jgi:hypothetical protein
MRERRCDRANPSRRGLLAAGAALGVGAGLLNSEAAAAGTSVTLERLKRAQRDPARRVLLKGRIVLILDPQIGDFERGDVLIDGKKILKSPYFSPPDQLLTLELNGSQRRQLGIGAAGRRADHLPYRRRPVGQFRSDRQSRTDGSDNEYIHCTQLTETPWKMIADTAARCRLRRRSRCRFGTASRRCKRHSITASSRASVSMSNAT